MPHAPHLRKFFGHRWRTLTRPRILKRAAGRCERCHKLVLNERYLEVAHLYIAPGEPGHDEDDNLMAFCVPCHKRHDHKAWSRACYLTRCRRKDAARPLLKEALEWGKKFEALGRSE